MILFVSVSCKDSVDRLFGISLTLYANDGTGTATTLSIDRKDGKIPACPFTREGFGHAGWNTKQDGSGTSYMKGDAIPDSGDLVLYARWGVALTETTDEWENGVTYALDRDITIGTRVSIDGAVALYLSEEYTLTASKGINVPGGSTITISGSGVLAAAGDDNAAIGGNKGKSTGTIVVNGGTINTTPTPLSNYGGAAIGSGLSGSGGTVSIHGGIVNATTGVGNFGAGIGGGQLSDGGTITISGGTVNATGGNGGAGIGGGGDGSGGTITISGGTVTARGGGGGAGIGGGSYGSGGTITISGGIVTADGGNSGAGIGGGDHGSGGLITISGGTVTASSEDPEASGIGGGYSGADGTLNHPGISLKVSSDKTDWEDYDGSNRKRYMKTN